MLAAFYDCFGMVISSNERELADSQLFKVEQLYGKNCITPNLHLHCHIKQCIYNYGPVYNFSLYSYERYNGILEYFPSSNHLIEIQIMQRYLSYLLQLKICLKSAILNFKKFLNQI